MNQGEDSTPTNYYAIAAFTYLVAMVTSNKALTWVNYPTQVSRIDYGMPTFSGHQVEMPIFSFQVVTLYQL